LCEVTTKEKKYFKGERYMILTTFAVLAAGAVGGSLGFMEITKKGK
jgi:hypothetical protein